MCDKEPYPNEVEARNAARGMSREYGQGMEHYFCQDCKVWHIKTRGKKPKWQKRNNKNKKRSDH